MNFFDETDEFANRTISSLQAKPNTPIRLPFSFVDPDIKPPLASNFDQVITSRKLVRYGSLIHSLRQGIVADSEHFHSITKNYSRRTQGVQQMTVNSESADDQICTTLKVRSFSCEKTPRQGGAIGTFAFYMISDHTINFGESIRNLFLLTCEDSVCFTVIDIRWQDDPKRIQLITGHPEIWTRETGEPLCSHILDHAKIILCDSADNMGVFLSSSGALTGFRKEGFSRFELRNLNWASLIATGKTFMK